MNYKYTFKDFLNGDIVLETRACNTNIISLKLQEYNINTKVIDEMVRITEPTVYLHVENDCLTILDNVGIVELNKKVILFDAIDPFEWNIKTNEFRLNQIVHVVINLKTREAFNPFANVEHVTAYVSCIDLKNKMCEVVYLHNKHKTIWVSFDEIYPIFNIYEAENEEFEIYREQEVIKDD